MRKVLVCAMLFGAMTAFTAATPSSALAQGDKKEKDTKKAKKAAATGTIEIGEGKDGKFRFFVRNEDGKLLAMSQPPGGFETEKDAMTAIEEFREVVAKAKVAKAAKKVDKEKDKKDKK